MKRAERDQLLANRIAEAVHLQLGIAGKMLLSRGQIIDAARGAIQAARPPRTPRAKKQPSGSA